MTTLVFVAVIAAAALHAVWNAIAKGGVDKTRSMAAVVLGHTPLAVAVLPFVPAPAPESWPYIAGGVALHVGYQLFLMASYRIGDLTQVYPIARGTAPLLVAGVSTVFLGVELSSVEWLAVLTIGSGILSLAFVRQGDGSPQRIASLLAFVTGCFIASYSLVDGTGARLAGTALGFYGYSAIGNTIVFSLFVRIRQPGTLTEIFRNGKRMALVGGSASFVAYALVVWAFTQAPIALVTALRETSIIFALAIGVLVLGEKLNLAKLISTFVIVLGAAMLRLAR